MTEPCDILYTPLDTSEPPDINHAAFMAWAESTKLQRADKDGSHRPGYPWKIAYGRIDCDWKFDFNNLFPEITSYVLDTFQLLERQVDTICFLPVRNDFIGTGFWHTDRDHLGLRFYLENDTPENAMLMRPLTEPFNTRQDFQYPDDGIAPFIQPIEYELSMPKLRQTFFINTARSVHAVKVTKLNSVRIATLVTVKGANLLRMPKYIRNLIVDSAAKHPEALLWTPPV
jgi:hypothetical protein